MDHDASRAQIVAAIIGLAHTLGKTVVAEGVEAAEQLATLRTLGCDFGQGYYFSRPVDAAAADALLRDPTPGSGYRTSAARSGRESARCAHD